MSRQKQAGFGMAVIITTIVVVLAVGGLVAWRVYVANKQSAQNNSSQPVATPASQSTTPIPQSDPNAGYVVIKEWGVRFKPVDGLKRVIYGPVVQPDTSVATMGFSTDELVAADANCTVARGAIGVLTRMTSIPESMPPSFVAATIHIGAYYYYYAGVQAVCADKPGTSTDQLQVQTGNLLRTSIATLEAAK